MGNEYELVNHLKIKHMNIFLVQLKYRTPHYHNEMELGLVLRGTLRINKIGNSYLYVENDIFVLNPQETHELLTEEESVLILSIQLSYKLYSSYYPSIKASQFLTSSIKDAVAEPVQQELLELMYQLSLSYFKQEALYEIRCNIYANQLLYALLSNVPYKLLSTAEQDLLSSRMSRLNRITAFIEDNFSRKLLLSEIAKTENLSLTYLSHFVRDNLGMSFQDYLNHIRFEHALQLIETTDHNILDISLESGFSDIRYLNKLFTRRYGCTPKQYRKNHNRKSEALNSSITSLQQILPYAESLSLLNMYIPNDKLQ